MFLAGIHVWGGVGLSWVWPISFVALGSDIEIMVREKQNDGAAGHFRMAVWS